jgi:hypothetical protein
MDKVNMFEAPAPVAALAIGGSSRPIEAKCNSRIMIKQNKTSRSIRRSRGDREKVCQ